MLSFSKQRNWDLLASPAIYLIYLFSSVQERCQERRQEREDCGWTAGQMY
jgi:hypothetical protein